MPSDLVSRRMPNGDLRRRRQFRALAVESLEGRRLMNVDWRNPVDSLDVDADGFIVPRDALLVINHLNADLPRDLPTQRDPARPFLDSSGDQFVSPLDALLVINQLNAEGSGSRTLDEGFGFAHESDLIVTLDQPGGARTIRVAIDARLDTSDTGAALEDLLAVYLVDPAHPEQTLLDRGTAGTALFTLAGNAAEFAPGVVRWDGAVLELDTSVINDRDTGLLRFQLLDNDADRGTRITLRPLSNTVDATATPGVLTPLATRLAERGESLDVGSFASRPEARLEVENVRFDAQSGKYSAEIQVWNGGAAFGRDAAVVFPGLPAGVNLTNPSGITASGAPYVNLRAAVPAGGLGKNLRSTPVLVEFTNPANVPFALRPQIVAAENRPPQVGSIGAISTRPGGVVRIEAPAVDPDGDPLLFWIDSLDTLPNMTLDGQGVLEIRPAPGQVGTYAFDLQVSDGRASVAMPVSLEVAADPAVSTRISGRVLDVDGTPLVGLRVESGAVQGLTLADGSFTLDLGTGPIVSDTLRVRGDLLAGPKVYPFISEKLALVLEHAAYVGVDNLIDRPIYLPPLDVANGRAIDPLHDTDVTTPELPGAKVHVAAGTLMNQQGTPFTGVLSMTEVPPELTPAALPDGLLPDLVVTIQPGEMVFAAPAPLSLPNRSGYAPGTKLDLWSINPVTGTFEIVGLGQVSADGQVIETIEGGIRNSSWHAFVQRIIDVITHVDVPPLCVRCIVRKIASSDVELDSGAIVEQHSVASYSSPSGTGGVQLVYNSMNADVRPIVQFNASFECLLVSTGARDNQARFSVTVSANQGNTKSLVGGGVFGLPSCSSGESQSLTGSIVTDVGRLPSGVYNFEVKAGILVNGGSSGRLSTVSAPVSVVNSTASVFGAGWGVSGVQEIVENADGSASLIDGSGVILTFAKPLVPGGPYVSPSGDFSVLEKLVDGTFRRTLRDQTIYQFNDQRRLATILDRNDNLTQYRYANGRLVEIIDPVLLSTQFTYADGFLETIVDPYGRVTRFEFQRGDLVRSIAPDGAVTTWEYDERHRVVAMIDANGRRGEDEYDATGRAIGSRFADGATSRVSSLRTVGAATLGATSWDSPATLSADPVAVYVDVNGNVTRMRMDRFGQPVEVADSVGPIAKYDRDGRNLLTQYVDALGNVVAYEYDERGNVTSVTDDINFAPFTPTASWIGTSGGEWHDPANWSGGRVPGPLDDVIVNVPNVDATIVIDGTDVQVRRLLAFEQLMLDGVKLKVTGDGTLFQDVNTEHGGALEASGEGVELELRTAFVGAGGTLQASDGAELRIKTQTELAATSVSAVSLGHVVAPQLLAARDVTMSFQSGAALLAPLLEDIDGSSIFVSGATTLFTLPAGVTRSGTRPTSTTRTFQAAAGATLDLSSLTEIVPSELDWGVFVRASGGGEVLLPHVAAWSNNSVLVRAEGTGSHVDLSGLTSWRGDGGWSFYTSSLTAVNNGAVTAPNLVALESVDVELDATGSLSTEQLQEFSLARLSITGQSVDLHNLTLFENGTLSLAAGAAVDMSALTSLDGSSIVLTGPTTSFTLPAAVTRSRSLTGQDIRLFQAADGATLNLSSLTEIDPSPLDWGVFVRASGGGEVLLPHVTAWSNNSVLVRAEGTGSHVDLSGLTSWRGDGGWSFYTSSLTAVNNGTVSAPNLLALESVDLELDATGSLSTEQLQEFSLARLSITGQTVDLHNLTSFENGTLSLAAGAAVDLSALTSLDGSSIVLTGPTTSFTLPAAVTRSRSLTGQEIRLFQAADGATLNLSSLTEIEPSPLDWGVFVRAYGGGEVLLPHVTAWSNNSVLVRAEGTGSHVDLSGLTSWRGDGAWEQFTSSLTVVAGGAVSASNLLALESVDLEFDATGSLSTGQLQEFSFARLSITGQTVDLHHLTLFENGTLSLADGAAIDMSALTSLDGSSIVLTGPTTSFTLPPAVTRSRSLTGQDIRLFQAADGATLDLSSLTEIEPSPLDWGVFVRAYGGGEVLLPHVTAWSNNSVLVRAEGTGSHVDLSGLTSWRGDGAWEQFTSSLTIVAGGAVSAPNLLALESVDLELDATGSLPTGQLQEFSLARLSITGQTVDLHNLTSFVDGTLSLVDGAAVDMSALTSLDGSSIVLTGPTTSFTLPAAVTRSRSLTAQDNRLFQAADGATLDLSSLTEIEPSPDGWGVFVRAYSGSEVLLPHVTAWSNNSVLVRAEGTGSHVDLSGLTSWRGDGAWEQFTSSLTIVAGGAIIASNLLALESVDLELDATGSLPTGQLQEFSLARLSITGQNVDLHNLTLFENGTLSLADGAAVDMSALTSLDGSSIVLTGPTTSFTLPAAVTRSRSPLAQNTRLFQAADGATLDLSSLTAIEPSPAGWGVFVRAYGGGEVLLPHVTAWSNNSVLVRAEGTGSHVDLSGLTSWRGDGVWSAFVSSLTVVDGGVVRLPSLLELESVDATYSAAPPAELAAVTHWLSGSLSVTDSTLTLPLLVDADDTSFSVDGGLVEALLLANLGDGVVTLVHGGVLHAPLLFGEGEPGSGASNLAPPGDSGEAEPDDPPPEIPSPRPRMFAYDEVFNQLAEETDDLGRLTLYDLDPANGNALAMRRVVGRDDRLSGESDDQITRYTYTAHGLLDTLTDPRGVVSDWDYDAFDRPVRIAVAVGTYVEAVWRTEYDAFGNVAAQVDPNGSRTEYAYDLVGRLTLVRDALGHETRYRYDAVGNLIEQTDARGQVWKFRYDARDRLIESEDPQHQITRQFYDQGGNLVKTVDPLGHATRHEYDVRGRRVRSIDPDGGVIDYAYDLNDNLIALTDPVGNTTRFEYDSRSRQITEIDPLGHAIRYTYDAADNLIAKLDRNGRTTRFEYDQLDRLTRETWVNGANVIEYAYDAADNLTSIHDAFSSLAYEYDSRGRVLSVDNAGTPNAPHAVLDYTYDAVGNVTSVFDTMDGQLGATTSYAYDPLDRLSVLTQTGQGLSDKRVDFTYNALGQYEHIRRYSDLAATQPVIDTEYSYDNLSRIAAIDHRNSAGVAVSFFHYSYDSSSRITRITDVDGTIDYGFDDRDQLIAAEYSDLTRVDEYYQYDANGNRLASYLHGDDYETGPANRLLSDGTYDYEYDDEGNTIRRTEIATGDYREFTWDWRNRLTEVVDRAADGEATQNVLFVYDAIDRRISKAVDTTPKDAVASEYLSFAYDREDVIMDLIDDDHFDPTVNTMTKRRLHGPEVDQVLAQDAGNTAASYFLPDHQNTTRSLMAFPGDVQYKISYESFGDAETSATSESRVLFAGREYDHETQAYFLRSRYYFNDLGRFASADQLNGTQGDPNRYRYSENTPITRTDPFGFDSSWEVHTGISKSLCLGDTTCAFSIHYFMRKGGFRYDRSIIAAEHYWYARSIRDQHSPLHAIGMVVMYDGIKGVCRLTPWGKPWEAWMLRSMSSSDGYMASRFDWTVFRAGLQGAWPEPRHSTPEMPIVSPDVSMRRTLFGTLTGRGGIR